MTDEIILTMPDEPALADVAAQTAVTVALRVGFSGAQVDRLRDEVAAAFEREAARADGDGPLAVRFLIGAEGVSVLFGEGSGVAVHLRRRGPTE
jgi:hypothetical protein